MFIDFVIILVRSYKFRILLILSKRLESKKEEDIENQFGFWKGKDIRDAIVLMRII